MVLTTHSNSSPDHNLSFDPNHILLQYPVDLNEDVFLKTLNDIFPIFLQKYSDHIHNLDHTLSNTPSTTLDFNAYRRNWYHNKYHNDPDFKLKHQNHSKQSNYHKYHNDPEFRQKKLDQSKKRYQQKKLLKQNLQNPVQDQEIL
jgi:hypothetical protein